MESLGRRNKKKISAMKIKTGQFGEIEFDDEIIINFPDGIIGFEDLKRFIRIEDVDYQPFRWLISVDEPEIGFAVLDPTLVVENYYEDLGFDPEKSTLLGIVKLEKEISKITINLKAPIVIDNFKKLGRQIIIDKEKYGISQPIFAGKN